MEKDHSELVKEHFEMKYYDFDILIRNLIPKYEEMHQLIVDLVDFPRDSKLEILDLGVGSGQTAFQLLEKYSEAHIDGIDISPKMIEQSKIRLKDNLNRISFTEIDMKNLEIEKQYNACVAVLSIHHLNEQEKPIFFKKMYNNIKKGGIFVIGDIIKFNDKEKTKIEEEKWRQFLLKNLGNKEGQFWFENYQEEDLPSSTENQLKWLKEAGFTEGKCVWEHINYAVFYGKKS